MLTAPNAKKISTQVQQIDKTRRELQGLSSEILNASKRAIFAVHREDRKEAKSLLEHAIKQLKQGWTLVKKQPRVTYEGSWRAAQEEFVEASLVLEYLEKGSVSPVKDVSDDPDIFLGGLSDFTGELVRRAVLLATERKNDEVESLYREVRSVIDFLMQMDLTGTLRTKLDQAKQNLRKLEEVRYDLSLRKN